MYTQLAWIQTLLRCVLIKVETIGGRPSLDQSSFHIHSEPNHGQRTNTEGHYDDSSCTTEPWTGYKHRGSLWWFFMHHRTMDREQTQRVLMMILHARQNHGEQMFPQNISHWHTILNWIIHSTATGSYDSGHETSRCMIRSTGSFTCSLKVVQIVHHIRILRHWQ